MKKQDNNECREDSKMTSIKKEKRDMPNFILNQGNRRLISAFSFSVKWIWSRKEDGIRWWDNEDWDADNGNTSWVLLEEKMKKYWNLTFSRLVSIYEWEG